MKTRVISTWMCAIIMITGVEASSYAVTPENFTQVVYSDGQQYTLRLTRESLRGPDFNVKIQQDSGAFADYDAGEVRTYLGTVDEDPFANVAGYLQSNGVFRSVVYFDRGVTEYYEGSTKVGGNGTQSFSVRWPTTPTVSAGHGGTTMYEYQVGIDIDYTTFSQIYNSSYSRTMENVEYCMAELAAIHMRDAILKPVIGKVVIRASASQTPYDLSAGNSNLTRISGAWSEDMGYCFKVGLMLPSYGGGVAYLGGSYSVNSTKSNGQFVTTWRHEIGHNWGIADYEANNPEGPTLMCGNQRGRYCGPGVQDMLNHRDSRIGTKLYSVGTYATVNLPPYAALDTVEMTSTPNISKSITFDPIANDHDGNGHSLSIASVDSTTNRGGTVTISSGTGPNGRDELIYTAPANAEGLDWFYYVCEDSSGQKASGLVVVKLNVIIPPMWTVETDADTFVEGHYDNDNFGSAGYIVIKRSTAGATTSWTRTGWVHFDISGKQLASNARLTFTRNSGDSGGTVNVWGVKDGRPGDELGTDWSEGSITGSNAPLKPDFAEDENTTLVGSFAISPSETFTIQTPELAEFLAANTNGEVTFLLARNPNDGNFAIKSRESGFGATLSVAKQPAQDTYVRGGSYANDNFGAENSMKVKLDSYDTYVRNSYFSFDYANAGSGSIENATLTLMPTSVQGSRTLRLQLLDDADDGWDESSITWNSAPASTGGSIYIYSSSLRAGQPYTVDVTQLLNQSINQNTVASFRLDTITSAQTGVNQFATKEYSDPAWHPRLNVTMSDPAPSAPGGLFAVNGNGFVKLEWDESQDQTISQYRVYRAERSNAAYELVGISVGTNFTDNQVVNETTYYYVVTAVDSNGDESAYSIEVSATPGLVADINLDGRVDYADYSLLIGNWQSSGAGDIYPAGGDNIVDFDDLRWFAEEWLN
ncbi:Alpha-amylase/pullulanase [Anaerohalosphaera lusitana]|uniref:Alpha-amylase/pullulanase n=1 Tax=Anaerohalosphaera lusitana TaxID=1936003 RepID=A0A1U9NLM5_9BACT|nr:DNRLRE domain-containing protein [Anaerohalosphaera lusitana]AQT68470.1 Alpha-amylase/pullulanase [Anaerohalosphaera lusitana]